MVLGAEQVAGADGSRVTSLAERRASAAPLGPPLRHTVRRNVVCARIGIDDEHRYSASRG